MRSQYSSFTGNDLGAAVEEAAKEEDEDDVRYMGDILGDFEGEDDLVFDDGMRSADAATLVELMANAEFQARCERCCGAARAQAMRSQYSSFTGNDLGAAVEVVVTKYGAPHLRPISIAERSRSGDSADGACMSIVQLLAYMTAEVVQDLYNTGKTYVLGGEFSQAIDCLTRAIAADPSFPEPYNVLGRAYLEQGDVRSSIHMYERCIELAPSAATPAHNRLLCLNYPHDVPAGDLFEAHKSWGQWFDTQFQHIGAFEDWPNVTSGSAHVRIGYISPDFCDHSTSFFARCLLEHYDRDRFSVFVYANTMREDGVTESLRSMIPTENWRHVVGLSALEVAKLIREDGIRILIDLAGHTADNRLDVMVLKPAPVQFTYIGYPNTTGLKAVDFLISDAQVDPPEIEREQFTERLVCLPGCFLCYSPPARFPAIQWKGPKEGQITFGSLSNLAKLSAPCISLWARVLAQIPGSRLVLKAHGFQSLDVQAKFLERFKSHGVSGEQLELSGPSPRFEALQFYNDIDVALDTFPYSGTTTVCEALLMGVPVISLQGDLHRSRVGASLLAVVGLSRFVAGTADEYVEKASHLAGDKEAMVALRSTLHDTFLTSPLCDGRGFMRKAFEPAILKAVQSMHC